MDDDESIGPYDEGEWKWDDDINELVFTSNKSPEEEYSFLLSSQNFVGPIIFKEDLDHLEQERFHKRYCRKTAPGESDIVTLQDIKDVVLFTAPVAIVNKDVIDLLHLPITERFLRALILFCQYYLQLSEKMAKRKLEAQKKIRTKNSDTIEKEMSENLATMRSLIGKEYCSMLIGTGKIAKFHHMGSNKKARSMTHRERNWIKIISAFSIQIVWIALGRTPFNSIQSEIRRLFRSDIFNRSRWKSGIKSDDKLSREESLVLRGNYQPKKNSKFLIRSPLIGEILGVHEKDYRTFGLGVVKYPRLTPRLKYLEQAISAPEDQLSVLGISLGIIGLPRDRFNVMLREIKHDAVSRASSTPSLAIRISRSKSRSRISASQASSGIMCTKLYPDIVLPRGQNVTYEEDVLEEFSKKSKAKLVCNQVQYQKWLDRLDRIKLRAKKK